MVDRAVKEATSPIPPTSPLKLARRVAATSIAIFGSNILYVAKTLREVADDPADHNYQEVAQPASIELPPVDVAHVLDESQAVVLDDWRRSLAQGVALAAAFLTALNRAQGAEVDGNAQARDTQLAAARTFAAQWAANVLQAAGLRLQVAVAISPFELDEIAISRDDVWQIQSDIVASGWPAETVDTLSWLQIDAGDRDLILRKATSLLNESAIVNAGPAAALNDPAFAAEETELISILNEFQMAL